MNPNPRIPGWWVTTWRLWFELAKLSIYGSEQTLLQTKKLRTPIQAATVFLHHTGPPASPGMCAASISDSVGGGCEAGRADRNHVHLPESAGLRPLPHTTTRRVRRSG